MTPHNACSSVRVIGAALAALTLLTAGAASSADLGHMAPVPAANQWSFNFTTYGWLPWLSGDTTIKGRSLEVDIAPNQVIDALDWSVVPMWMSYAEARKGRLTLFNDVVYAQLAGSGDFAKTGRLGIATLAGNVKADYEQVTIEAGAAYEIWGGGLAGSAGFAGLDVLAGARYWHQETEISAFVDTGIGGLPSSGGRVFARSGSVDWVDPFVGARMHYRIAAGQEFVLRGDIGGFGAGSDFSWQALATYNWQLCTNDGYVIDGYLGYRALSVDYSQGAGNTKYEYDVLQQGPVTGLSIRF